jgi:peptide/nickel transport system ATP-binding protein
VRGKDVGVVFQDPMTSLNPVIRVRDQMVPPIQRHLGLNRDAATARAVELLGQVGIPDPARRISAYPHELSGGMRQRVLIAMALSGGPDLVIADEPTTALDVTIQAQIVALLKNLAENSGTSVLFVTHDFGLVARFAHTIAVMYAGRIVEYGPAERVFHRPEHPYTRALLESIPAITGEKPDRLTQIEGTPPDLARLGSGCSFAPRCSRTAQICREHRPDLTLREAQHTAACWVTANSPVQGRSQADPFSKEREIVAVG